MKIQKAHPEEASALTVVAIAAKAYWGYPNQWMRRWEKELTITSDYVSTHPTYTATMEGHLVGFCAVLLRSGEAVLDHLWVLPAAMGSGVGRRLFKHAENVAREAGAPRIKIVGDPHAEGFYHAMGATLYGRQPSTVAGVERFLPLFEKRLS